MGLFISGHWKTGKKLDFLRQKYYFGENDRLFQKFVHAGMFKKIKGVFQVDKGDISLI